MGNKSSLAKNFFVSAYVWVFGPSLRTIHIFWPMKTPETAKGHGYCTVPRRTASRKGHDVHKSEQCGVIHAPSECKGLFVSSSCPGRWAVVYVHCSSISGVRIPPRLTYIIARVRQNAKRRHIVISLYFEAYAGIYPGTKYMFTCLYL